METVLLSEELLNKLKKIEIGILIEIDNICKSNGLHYSLAAGTLLGSVRHKGFIPWDDDIDIMMVRTDYEKLIKIIGSSTDLYIADYRLSPDYGFPFCKVMKKGTIFRELSNCFNNAPSGVYVDVFPIDFTTNDERLREKQYDRVQQLKNLLLTRENYYFGQVGLREILRIIKRQCLKLIPKSLIVKAIEAECAKYSEANSEIVISLGGNVGVTKSSYPAVWFHEFTEMEFEGKVFSVIREYRELLEIQYGDFWTLPPKDSQQPHHSVCEIRL